MRCRTARPYIVPSWTHHERRRAISNRRRWKPQTKTHPIRQQALTIQITLRVPVKQEQNVGWLSVDDGITARPDGTSLNNWAKSGPFQFVAIGTNQIKTIGASSHAIRDGPRKGRIFGLSLNYETDTARGSWISFPRGSMTMLAVSNWEQWASTVVPWLGLGWTPSWIWRSVSSPPAGFLDMEGPARPHNIKGSVLEENEPNNSHTSNWSASSSVSRRCWQGSPSYTETSSKPRQNKYFSVYSEPKNDAQRPSKPIVESLGRARTKADGQLDLWFCSPYSSHQAAILGKTEWHDCWRP